MLVQMHACMRSPCKHARMHAQPRIPARCTTQHAHPSMHAPTPCARPHARCVEGRHPPLRNLVCGSCTGIFCSSAGTCGACVGPHTVGGWFHTRCMHPMHPCTACTPPQPHTRHRTQTHLNRLQVIPLDLGGHADGGGGGAGGEGGAAEPVGGWKRPPAAAAAAAGGLEACVCVSDVPGVGGAGRL